MPKPRQRHLLTPPGHRRGRGGGGAAVATPATTTCTAAGQTPGPAPLSPAWTATVLSPLQLPPRPRGVLASGVGVAPPAGSDKTRAASRPALLRRPPLPDIFDTRRSHPRGCTDVSRVVKFWRARHATQFLGWPSSVLAQKADSLATKITARTKQRSLFYQTRAARVRTRRADPASCAIAATTPTHHPPARDASPP